MTKRKSTKYSYDNDEFSEEKVLRDWFAGQALIGIGTWSPADFDYTSTKTGKARQRCRAAEQAAHAYMVADAMLEARKK